VKAYFFDSSALVKRYTIETGTPWVESTISQNPVYLARITVVEVISAIERRKRAGNISEPEATKAIADFRFHLLNEYTLVDLTEDLIEEAVIMVQTHGLRAYDAVQLAAVLKVDTARRSAKLSSLILVSSDLALNNAATSEGLIVEDPNNH
jgi:predicted nucleic acid-binding protein